MRRRLFPVLGAILVFGGSMISSFAQTSQPASTASSPPMELKVGDMAPDFTLRDQSGKEVSLRDFRGKKTVALAFYVFAFSGG